MSPKTENKGENNKNVSGQDIKAGTDFEHQDLRSILNVPAIQSLLEDFTELTQMVTAILDLNGNILVATGWQGICTRFHRIHPQTAAYCTESDLFLARNLREGEYVAYKCKNNLWDVVTPFYLSGKHVGNIFTGQFFYEDETVDVDRFRKMAELYGFDQERYLEALARVPHISRNRVKTLMDFLVKLSAMVSQLSYSNLLLNKAISDQKQVESALRESEQHFRQLIEHSPIPIAVSNVLEEIEFLNERFVTVFGYTLNDIPSLEHWWLRAYPDEVYRREVRKSWTEATQKAARDHTDIEPHEYRITAKNGKTRISEIFGTWLGDRQLTLLNDITDRKLAETKLKQYGDIVANMQSGLYVYHLENRSDDHSLRMVSANAASTMVLGLNREEIIGKTIDEIFPNLRRQGIPQKFADVVRSGVPFEMEDFDYDDEHILSSCFSFKVFAMPGDCVCVLFEDITNRKLLEEKMILSEKLAGLGRLAAGVAHELNTPLQLVTGQSESLLRHLQKNDIDQERMIHKLEDIRRSGWRCAEIVRSLLTYAHPTTLQFEPNSFNQLVLDTLLIARNQQDDRPNILIETDLAEDLPQLICDRNQIIQVLINLLGNARDALRKGGKITIQTGYDKSKQSLFLRVSDTGPGIPDTIREKIFDPFFTTKTVGSGIGLGLSFVSSIVRFYDGEITVENGIPSGAVFTLYFPEKGVAPPPYGEHEKIPGRY